MTDHNVNPRALIGDNQQGQVDFAAEIAAEMEREYKALCDTITGLLEQARAQPADADTEEQALAMGAIVKELGDAYNRADAYREAEKHPHMRCGQGVDSFFFSWMEKCRRRNPRDRSQKPGAANILQARIDAFLERKAVEEETRRRREAEIAAEAARKAQEELDRLAREKREAEEAAARARKPENVEAHTQRAEEIAPQVDAAIIEANIAIQEAEAAHIATLARPADLSRTRGPGGGGSGGVLLTQKRDPYAILVDRALVDMNLLQPYFTEAEIEKALRGWAKATNHAKQMPGAEIGVGRKGQTR